MIGSLVMTNNSAPLVITAQDMDSQVNALLEYDIVEHSARRMFHIDSTTGRFDQIRASKFLLEYEQNWNTHIENMSIGMLGKVA